MDRLEFSKSIECDSTLEESIKVYFDETMLLYDLVGDYTTNHVIRNVTDGTVSFSILFKSKKEAQKMQEAVNGCRIDIYYNKFDIISILSNRTVDIELKNI